MPGLAQRNPDQVILHPRLVRFYPGLLGGSLAGMGRNMDTFTFGVVSPAVVGAGQRFSRHLTQGEPRSPVNTQILPGQDSVLDPP